MTTIDELRSIHRNQITSFRGEDSDLTRTLKADLSEKSCTELSEDISACMTELCEDLETHAISENFLSAVTKYLNHKKPDHSETERDEVEAAHRAASNLYALCQLMSKLNEILTDLQVHSAEMFYSLKEPQRKAYEKQKESHTIKAFVSLGAGILSGGSQIIGVGFGDTGKAVGEAIGKAFSSVGQCVTTLQDGDIQGGNSYEIKSVESDLNQDQSKLSNIEQTTTRFWQTLEAILRDIAQTNHLAAQG
jgi:hypothetical protein